MTKEIELSKRDQIDDLKQTIAVCEHIIAFEPISMGSQELLMGRIENCQLRITRLQYDLKDTLPSLIYNICKPSLS